MSDRSDISGKFHMYPLSGMSEMYDKSDIYDLRGYTMASPEMRAEVMLNAVIAEYNMIEHIKSCDICLKWTISDISAYELKCVEGWSYLHLIRLNEDNVAFNHSK